MNDSLPRRMRLEHLAPSTRGALKSFHEDFSGAKLNEPDANPSSEVHFRLPVHFEQSQFTTDFSFTTKWRSQPYCRCSPPDKNKLTQTIA